MSPLVLWHNTRSHSTRLAALSHTYTNHFGWLWANGNGYRNCLVFHSVRQYSLVFVFFLRMGISPCSLMLFGSFNSIGRHPLTASTRIAYMVWSPLGVLSALKAATKHIFCSSLRRKFICVLCWEPTWESQERRDGNGRFLVLIYNEIFIWRQGCGTESVNKKREEESSRHSWNPIYSPI